MSEILPDGSFADGALTKRHARDIINDLDRYLMDIQHFLEGASAVYECAIENLSCRQDRKLAMEQLDAVHTLLTSSLDKAREAGRVTDVKLDFGNSEPAP